MKAVFFVTGLLFLKLLISRASFYWPKNYKNWLKN